MESIAHMLATLQISLLVPIVPFLLLGDAFEGQVLDWIQTTADGGQIARILSRRQRPCNQSAVAGSSELSQHLRRKRYGTHAGNLDCLVPY